MYIIGYMNIWVYILETSDILSIFFFFNQFFYKIEMVYLSKLYIL